MRFTVRDGDRFVLLPVGDLDWIEAAATYVRLHTGTRSFEVRMTMAEVEPRLDPRRFTRIHRSAIVNLDRIRAIHPDWHGQYTVALASGTSLRLGRRYRDRLF